MKRVLKWYASLPLTIVAAQSLLIGLLFSSMEAEGWIFFSMSRYLDRVLGPHGVFVDRLEQINKIRVTCANLLANCKRIVREVPVGLPG
ncbi:MAG: hypothetical protein AB7G13_22435 [Lautropia sp.]